MTNPRAPADSPCELLPCPFCGYEPSHWEHISRGTIVTCFYEGCPAHGNTVSPTVWNTRAAPPVLSARPNEAVVGKVCGYLFGEDNVRRYAIEFAGKSMPYGTILYATPPNEADAPRGQAVACWIDGADIGFLSDGLKSSAHVYPHQELPCCVPLYASPVGEADGVRENFIPFDDTDVAMAFHMRAALQRQPWPSSSFNWPMAEHWLTRLMLAAGGVPQEGK